MAEHVGPGDRVDLDVTHGFRHLPMLAILAALHLRSVRGAEIGGIWYGAYDPDSGAAPVHDLAGLLHIADWLQALHTYDKDGDYGAFAPAARPGRRPACRGRLLRAHQQPGQGPREALRLVEPGGPVSARRPGRGAVQRCARTAASVGIGAARGRTGSARSPMQYLDRQDYVRAAIYAQESVITAQVTDDRGNINDFQCRAMPASA